MVLELVIPGDAVGVMIAYVNGEFVGANNVGLLLVLVETGRIVGFMVGFSVGAFVGMRPNGAGIFDRQ